MIIDIIYDNKSIIINVRTKRSKSLIYQVIFLINLGAIVLTIILIIALIENQKRELKQRNINALVYITTAVKTNSNI